MYHSFTRTLTLGIIKLFRLPAIKKILNNSLVQWFYHFSKHKTMEAHGKSFLLLLLRAIKEAYFDDGLQEHVKDDYYTIGLIMGR